MPARTNPEEFYKELKEKEAKLKLIRARMVEIARNLIGAPAIRYRNPELGMSPEGYDCSGFVSAVIAQAADDHEVPMSIPRHANEQWRIFGEPVSYPQRQAGDLVYFPSRRKRSLYVVGHVGLVVSMGEYIHSPGKDNTQITAAELPTEQKGLADIKPEDIHTHTPIGIKRLSLPIGSGRWHVH